LVIEPSADPLHRFKLLGINVIQLPLGLVASPKKRALAFLALLDLLLERNLIECPERDKAKQAIKTGYEECGKNQFLGQVLHLISPKICCVGQLAKGRLIGLSDAAAQETFHGPAAASAAPDSDPEVLIDGVDQILPVKGTETAPGLATETITTTTWFGNRTGFDSYRFFDPRSKRLQERLAVQVPHVPISRS